MNSVERQIANLRRMIAWNEENLRKEPEGAAGAVASSYLKRDRAELDGLLRKVEEGKPA